MYRQRMIKKLSLGVLIALSLGCSLPMHGQNASSNKKSYTKALDVMGSSMALLNRYFVDSVNIEKISKIGINAMLHSLDPYTEYFSEEDSERLRLITTGEYGGIGAIISQRPDSTVIINDPMEGMPAAEAGLKAGDVILEVNGHDHRRSSSEAVTKDLKGEPGSMLTILVQRMGEKKPRKVSFKRRKIRINPVSYYGMIDQDLGYVALNSFPNTATIELKKALDKLMQEPNLRGLVLDLRGNVGGLLDEAVKVVNLFVPKGKAVVMTKQRADLKQDITLKTMTSPIAPRLPLAVLIDSETASSAEIVSGALQDLDRAVIIGQKSFGKGLVQTTMQLPHNGVLKLTTAKYYIPSGRCIQRIDYKKVRDGQRDAVLPDSLTHTFYTEAGRPVRDAGGILPDIQVSRDSLPTMMLYLGINPDAFDWITAYTLRHKSIASPTQFQLSDEDYADFGRMLIEKKFDYDRQTAKSLSTLEEISKIEGYYTKHAQLMQQLREALKPDLKHDLESLRPHIESFLESSIVGRYYYRRGVIERELLTDKVVQEAKEVLRDAARYSSILSPSVQTATSSAK